MIYVKNCFAVLFGFVLEISTKGGILLKCDTTCEHCGLGFIRPNNDCNLYSDGMEIIVFHNPTDLYRRGKSRQ